jgi:thiol-disulfide isomerase/thioredoxin
MDQEIIMLQIHLRIVGIFVSLSCLSVSRTSLAEMPPIEEVLRICRENREKLNPLHVQVTHTEERTDAYAKSQQKQAVDYEMLLKALDDPKSAADLEKQMPGISTAEYKKMLQESVKNNRMLAQSARFEHKYEFFIRGEDYQVRSVLEPFEKDWKFPIAPLSPQSMGTDYAGVRIYSRSAPRTPPAHIWPGKSGPNDDAYAMPTAKHIGETHSIRFPPFMEVMHPGWEKRHPIDTFFSAPVERYCAVGQEEKDGRLLTIVDVAVPTELKSGVIDEHGQPQQVGLCYWYRAWLDLAQGGIPVTMHFWWGTEGKSYDERFAVQPARVLKTTEIKRLENGAYYPMNIVEEEFNIDPTVPQLTEAQWKEVRAGIRQSPPQVVFQRQTWVCEAIDTNDPGGADFFVLKFPEGQKYFDLDTGKVVGALDRTPPLKAGEKEAPLSVARWLDGRQHSLEEFRGKVVVLDFWGLWCSPCRNSVPALVTVQEKFKDKPVVFVSIHTADTNLDELVERIEKFAAEQGWHYLAAIDAGTMSEDSATSHAYGVDGFPTQMIIGADGIVKYNSSEPPPGLEGIMGKPCDEATPEDMAKLEAFMKKEFESAGEKWPGMDGGDEKATMEAMNRVNAFHMSRRIEAALAERKK